MKYQHRDFQTYHSLSIYLFFYSSSSSSVHHFHCAPSLVLLAIRMNENCFSHNFHKWEENFIVHVKDWEINHRRRGEFYPLWFFFHSLCRYQIVDGIWQKNIFIYISHFSTVPRQNESPQITALTTRSQQRYFNL